MYITLQIFLEKEHATSNMPPIIIVHGGRNHDFPMLLSNCRKHKCNYSALHQYSFLDSMVLLKQKGYSKPGFANHDKEVRKHSALEDAKDLRKICHEEDTSMMLEDCFTCYKIEQYLSVKLPIGIQTLYKLSQ